MAARFWVGGTGTWDNADTSHWSATTGGAGGASVPTVADDAFFDGASGGGTITIFSSASTCFNWDSTGFTGAFNGGGGTLTVKGSITVGAGIGAMGFFSMSPATGVFNTLTTNGKTLSAWVVNGAGTGKVTLADNCTSGPVTLTAGTLDTNGKTCTWASFDANNSNTRTLTLGASAITITGASAQVFNVSTTTGFTMTTNTAVVTCTGTSASFNRNGDMNGSSIVMNGGGTAEVRNILTCVNFTCTGNAVKTAILQFVAATTEHLTCTGTCTLGGNSTQGVNRLLVQSTTIGAQRTPVAAAYVITGDVDFMDINLTYSGGASWTNTGNAYIGDALGNAGAVTTNTTTPATQTATGTASFTWSTHGWTSRVPLPQDDVVINNAFVAGQTITADMPRLGRSIDFTGCTGSPTLTNSVAQSLFGSLTLVAGVTPSGTNLLTFAGRSSYTLTSAGQTFTQGIQVNAPSGTVTLQDAFITSRSGGLIGYGVANGTLDQAAQSVTLSGATPLVHITGGTLAGTGTISVVANGTASTFWLVTGGTVTHTGTITLTSASTVSRTFAGGGKTYGTLTYTVANSPGALVITGANTFNTLNVGSGRVLTMPSATTNTITNFNVNGATNGYMYLPGVSGNYAQANDSAALSITSDIDIRCKVAMDSWTPSIYQSFVGKDQLSGSQRGFTFGMNSGGVGTLSFVLSSDGSNNAAGSSTAIGLAAGAVKWVRVTWRNSDDRVQFFTSDDGDTWTQLGTNGTIVLGGIFDNTSPLTIGNSNGNSNNLIGKMYRTQIRNNILDNGTGIVFDADFSTKAVGANTFTEGSSNAATVTINGNLAQAGDGRIIANSSTPGTKWTVSTAVSSASYVDVQDSTATGNGSPINNPTGVNRGNNGCWNFNVTGGSFFPFM